MSKVSKPVIARSSFSLYIIISPAKRIFSKLASWPTSPQIRLIHCKDGTKKQEAQSLQGPVLCGDNSTTAFYTDFRHTHNSQRPGGLLELWMYTDQGNGLKGQADPKAGGSLPATGRGDIDLRESWEGNRRGNQPCFIFSSLTKDWHLEFSLKIRKIHI